MSKTHKLLNHEFINALNHLAEQGFRNAADGYSGMIGKPMAVYDPSVALVPLKDIPAMLGGTEEDAVGIYIKVSGGVKGHMLLIMPLKKSLEMADRILNIPQGTTTKLGSLERSALAEMGNLTGSFFINAISNQVGLASFPSPPAVIVDMIGAILAAINAMVGNMGEDVLLFKATFMVEDRKMSSNFWVVFDPETLDTLIGEFS